MFTITPGTPAPDFNLSGSDGAMHDFASVKGANGTIVFFTCNHCPYVVGSEARMKELFAEVSAKGISMVAIHSNETEGHPSDAFPLVIERMKEMGFGWLSLDDGQQFTAKAYGATRTPHYFLFDRDGVLVYTGRMDNSPRDASQAETSELRDAIDDLLAGRAVRVPQTDAIGCNVKWWDKERHWMPGDACDLDYLYRKFPGK